MTRKLTWRLVRSRWVYQDARIVDVAWTGPADLTLSLQSMSNEVPQFPTRPIVCFRGVKNRAEIEERYSACRPTDFSCSGFSQANVRGRYSLGPFVIDCDSYVEP